MKRKIRSEDQKCISNLVRNLNFQDLFNFLLFLIFMNERWLWWGRRAIRRRRTWLRSAWLFTWRWSEERGWKTKREKLKVKHGSKTQVWSGLRRNGARWGGGGERDRPRIPLLLHRDYAALDATAGCWSWWLVLESQPGRTLNWNSEFSDVFLSHHANWLCISSGPLRDMGLLQTFAAAI